MKNKLLIIGSIALLMSAVKASPREEELVQKLANAKIIEKQNYQQMLLAKKRYHSAENYADKLANELRQLRKREIAEVRAYKAANNYSYSRVNPYITDDYSYPTNIRLREIK